MATAWEKIGNRTCAAKRIPTLLISGNRTKV
jgi:hypothetical protein